MAMLTNGLVANSGTNKGIIRKEKNRKGKERKGKERKDLCEIHSCQFSYQSLGQPFHSFKE